MDHALVIDCVTRAFEPEPAVIALFLAGSHGQGTADRFSDIDFVALAEAPGHARIAGLWKAALETLEPVVFWNERPFGGFLANAVTESWVRCDLILRAPDALGPRAQSTIRPLIDRTGIWDRLPADLPPRRPDPVRIRDLINEFIRVLGLLSVGLGREEYVLLVRGTGILRDLLSDLMVEECPLPDRGGALHPSRLVSASDMAVLAALPCPGPDRDDLIAAHVAIAGAFLPRARRIAKDAGVDWPEAFEAATRAHLRRTLGLTFA